MQSSFQRLFHLTWFQSPFPADAAGSQQTFPSGERWSLKKTSPGSWPGLLLSNNLYHCLLWRESASDSCYVHTGSIGSRLVQCAFSLQFTLDAVFCVLCLCGHFHHYSLVRVWFIETNMFPQMRVLTMIYFTYHIFYFILHLWWLR